MQGLQPHPLGNILGQNLGKFGRNLGKIWTNMGKRDLNLGKIKIFHSQKH